MNKKEPVKGSLPKNAKVIGVEKKKPLMRQLVIETDGTIINIAKSEVNNLELEMVLIKLLAFVRHQKEY